MTITDYLRKSFTNPYIFHWSIRISRFLRIRHAFSHRWNRTSVLRQKAIHLVSIWAFSPDFYNTIFGIILLFLYNEKTLQLGNERKKGFNEKASHLQILTRIARVIMYAWVMCLTWRDTLDFGAERRSKVANGWQL